MEALGSSEVCLRDVHAVDHHSKLGAALLHRSLADQVPDVGDGGEDNALGRCDHQIVLLNTGNLKIFNYLQRNVAGNSKVVE